MPLLFDDSIVTRNRSKSVELLAKVYDHVFHRYQKGFTMMISHPTLVYCRYILLEWLKRQENDPKTFGELFLMYCDAIQDME